MDYSYNEKKKIFYLTCILIVTFILAASFITFVINVSNNKGIVPLIFILLSIYSLIAFFYYLLFVPLKVNKGYKLNVKCVYVVFFITNMVLFIFSYLTLWC